MKHSFLPVYPSFIIFRISGYNKIPEGRKKRPLCIRKKGRILTEIQKLEQKPKNKTHSLKYKLSNPEKNDQCLYTYRKKLPKLKFELLNTCRISLGSDKRQTH